MKRSRRHMKLSVFLASIAMLPLSILTWSPVSAQQNSGPDTPATSSEKSPSTRNSRSRLAELPPGLVIRIDASGMATVEVPAGYEAANVAQLMEKKMRTLKPAGGERFRAIPLSATRVMCRGNVEDFKLLAACIVTVNDGRESGKTAEPPKDVDFSEVIRIKQRDYEQAEQAAARIASYLRQKRNELDAQRKFEKSYGVTGPPDFLPTGRIQRSITELSALLKSAVQSAFDHRMQLQQAQLDQAEAELDASRQRLDQRQKLSREIIQRRVEELESGKDASWLGEQNAKAVSGGDSVQRRSLEVDASLLPPDELLLKQPEQPRLPKAIDSTN